MMFGLLVSFSQEESKENVKYWLNIINQCKNRPENMTVKQWLADNGISDKSYYYWLRKIRLEVYEQLNVPSVAQLTEVSFDEIPLPTNEDRSSLLKEYVHTTYDNTSNGGVGIYPIIIVWMKKSTLIRKKKV